MTNIRFDPWAPILRRVVQPLYYARHGDRRFRHLSDLEMHQWLPSGRLRELQVERVNLLLRHAFDTTEFYRQRLGDCGLGSGPIESLDELSVLDTISKSDLQINGDLMLSRAYSKSALVKDASGGSTGKPTVFYKDLARHNLRRADQYRHDRWTGWNIGERWALIWGARQDLVDRTRPRERIFQRFVERCLSLDAFELSKETMGSFAERLRKFRPKMILGYAGALDRFARFIADANLSATIRPLAIVSSAESLTEGMRHRIQSAFDCPVLNRYGSREVGLIASECRARSGLHVNADNLLVEVLENGKPVAAGEEGDVVVTDFWNFGMPLIRYNMGDRAVASDNVCECGRGLPMLQSIEGRVSDFLVASDGTRIHGEYFTHLFYGNSSVAQFQFEQESRSKVTVKVVPAQGRTLDVSDVLEKTERILGGATVDLRLCEKIPPTPSGKYRFTISKVDDAAQPSE